MGVVPAYEQQDLVFESRFLERHEQQSPRAFVLDCSHQPLDDRDTALLADGPEPLPNPAATTPQAEPVVGELATLVGDQVS